MAAAFHSLAHALNLNQRSRRASPGAPAAVVCLKSPNQEGRVPWKEHARSAEDSHR
jgi:hypothetical protein